jgi:hypothetical protein
MNLQWSQQLGSSGWDWVSSLTPLSNSKFLISGGIPGSTLLPDSSKITLSDASDAFISCFDSSGILVWSHSFGSKYWDNIQSQIEVNNDIYIGGSFQDSIYISDTAMLSSPPFLGAFIGCYDLDGILKWVKNPMGKAIVYSVRLAAADSSSFFMSCTFKDTLAINSINYITDETPDLIIARVDLTGEVLQYRIVKFYGDLRVNDLESNSSKLFIAGSFSNSIDLGDSVIYSHGGEDAFAICLSDSLSFDWIKTYGNWADDEISSLKLSNQNKILFSGSFEDSIMFDDYQLAAVGCNDIFVGEMDSVGNVNWIKQAGGYGNDVVFDIQSGNDSTIYLLGAYSGDLHFWPVPNSLDSINLNQTEAQNNAFISCYRSNGDIIGAFTCPGTSEDYGRAMAVDKNNNLIVVGSFNLNLQLTSLNSDKPSINYSSYGGHDIFLAKFYEPCPIAKLDLEHHISKCKGQSITIDGGANYEKYCWNNGLSQERLIRIDEAGKYFLTVKTFAGCFLVDSVLVSNYPEEMVFAGNDTIVNGNVFIPIAARKSGVNSVRWSTSGDAMIRYADSISPFIFLDSSYFPNHEITLKVEGYGNCSHVEDELILRRMQTSYGIVAYPNPTQGVINLKIYNSCENIESIRIFNLSGLDQIYEVQKGNTFAIDISELPPGQYYIQVVTNGSFYVLPITRIP